MYRQRAFAVDDLSHIHDLIDERAAAQVVTMCAGELEASLVPLLLDRTRGEFGTLIGHFARPNRQWRDSDPSVPALVLFSGPDAYVSPSMYPSKAETGRVVPTWNYVTVHAHGPLEVHDDAEFTLDVVRRLTDRHELHRSEPWSVDDAPADYIAGLVKAIVGFEIPITSIEASAKLSQNKSESDRSGVASALSDSAPGSPEHVIATLMRDL